MAEPDESTRDEILQETVRLEKRGRVKQWDFILERAADVLVQVEARAGDPILAYVFAGIDSELVQRAGLLPRPEEIGLVATGSAASATSSPRASKVVCLEAGMHSLAVWHRPGDDAEPLGFSVVRVAIHKSEAQ